MEFLSFMKREESDKSNDSLFFRNFIWIYGVTVLGLNLCSFQYCSRQCAWLFISDFLFYNALVFVVVFTGRTSQFVFQIPWKELVPTWFSLS